MPTIEPRKYNRPSKRNHDMADPRKNLQEALRCLEMLPMTDCGLVPHPLIVAMSEIKQALEAL